MTTPDLFPAELAAAQAEFAAAHPFDESPQLLARAHEDVDESDEDMRDVAEELRWQQFDAALDEERHNARR
jgi:hypothetical protein